MTTLVTGGAGFLGSHLVDVLVERGHDVVVLDNMWRGRRWHLQSHLDGGAVRLVEGDIRDEATVATVMRGVDLVYHLAAQSNVMGAIQDGSYSFTTNVVGTYNVLSAAASGDVRRVVFASSREVYGEPENVPVRETEPLLAKNPYGASKIAGEAYCHAIARSTGLEVAILRFANLYGPRDRDRVIPLWIDRALRGESLLVYGGAQILDFLSVRHAVAALLAAGDADLSAPVNVGSGTGTPLLDLAARISQETGSRAGHTLLPARDVEVTRFVADTSRMAALGIDPPADPLDDLHAQVEWTRANARDQVAPSGIPG